MSEEETTEEQAGDAAASPDDILNSPAFLQRKLEVLESDIATAEEDLAAATERKEVAKEEWGPQLEALEREVSLKSARTGMMHYIDRIDRFIRVRGE